MKKFFCYVLSLVMLLTMFVGCSSKDEEITTVRVNEVTHSIFYAPFYLAMELGYFEEENINIELTNGGGSNVSMTAVISGQADVGLVGPETVVYVFNQGKEDYPVVFGQLTARDGSFLVGREKDEDFDYQDLVGKEILAGRKGGLPAMTLEYVLNQNGLHNGENVTLNYDVAFNMMAGAFDSGQADYTTMFEPTASDFQARERGHIVASIGEDSGEVPYTCFVATSSYLEENEKVAEGFLRAVYKALDYMENTDTKQVAEDLAGAFSGTSVDLIEYAVISYLEIGAWKSDMSMTKESFDRLQDIMIGAGELVDKAEFDMLIHNDISEVIKKEFK